MKALAVQLLTQVEDFEEFEDFGELEAAAAGTAIVFLLFWAAVSILAIIGLWKTFSKAGRPGWAAIIPFYNLYVLDEIAGRPAWWLVLWLIPIVNIVPVFVVQLDVARRFGKGPGFGFGLIFLSPIFYMILGFGNAQYQPDAA